MPDESMRNEARNEVTPEPFTPPAEAKRLQDAIMKHEQAPEHIMQFFVWGHLPAELQLVSQGFADVAEWIVANLPRNPERTVALRKLLEAKDAAVRARIAK